MIWGGIGLCIYAGYMQQEAVQLVYLAAGQLGAMMVMSYFAGRG